MYYNEKMCDTLQESVAKSSKECPVLAQLLLDSEGLATGLTVEDSHMMAVGQKIFFKENLRKTKIYFLVKISVD